MPSSVSAKQNSEIPRPQTVSSAGLMNLATPPSKMEAASTEAFDSAASDALLQHALKSVMAAGTDQVPSLQNVELKMDGLQEEATMPIILGQNIKLVPDATQVGGMSLTQNLQVAMVPVQKLAALQGVQGSRTAGMSSAAPPESGVTITPKSSSLSSTVSHPANYPTSEVSAPLTKGPVSVPALAPETLPTRAPAQENHTTTVSLLNKVPVHVAVPAQATALPSSAMVASSLGPDQVPHALWKWPVAPTVAAVPQPQKKEMNKDDKEAGKIEGESKTGNNRAVLNLERDLSQPLLLVDLPDGLLESAAASGAPHYGFSSVDLPQQLVPERKPPQGEGSGEQADLDISQFLNMPIKASGKDRSGQKRTAEQAGLSTSGARSVPATDPGKELRSLKIASPQNLNLDSCMKISTSKPALKPSVPFVTYSEDILGHVLAPTLLIQKEQEDCDIRIDEVCTEVKTEPNYVDYVAVFDHSYEREGTAKPSPSSGPSANSKRCRVIPMCISGQTLSRKRKRNVGKAGEVHIKSEPLETQDAPASMGHQKEDGETSDSNTEEAAGETTSVLEDACDALTASGDKQLCPIDDAGNEMRYGCYTCEFVAGSIWDVTDHWMKKHLSDRPYVCVSCSASFKTSFMAASHIKNCGPESPVTIWMKPSQIYNEPLLFEVCDNTGDAASCDAGPQESSFQMVEVPANIPLDDEVTELCDEQGKLINFLKEVHSASSKTEDGYYCNRCGTTTTTATEMELHVKEDHRKARPYGCSSCDQKFVCAFDLKRHQVRQHDPELVINFDKDQEKHVMEGTRGKEVSTSWTEAYTCTYSGSTLKEYSCKKCGCVALTEAGIVRHVIVTHNFISLLACQRCKYQFPRNQPFLKNTIECPQCMLTLHVPRSHCLATHFTSKRKVFVCRMCEYKSQDKSGMTRHIKYSHTTVRPYMCGYCEYSSVEKPKIRLHLFNHHKNRPSKIIRDDEMVESFRRCLPELFDKLTFVFEGSMDDLCKLQLRDGGKEESQEGLRNRSRMLPNGVNKDKEKEPISLLPSGHRRKPQKKKRAPLKYVDGVSTVEHTLYIRHVSTTSKGGLQCDMCGFRAKTWARCAAHVQQKHINVLRGSRQYSTWPQVFKPPYFRCTLCDYKCNDRSCMSRHIKYIHFDVHPHRCPVCSYRKVEKAKVRIHIKNHHPELGAHTDAITDRELFIRCTREAKRYYCLVKEGGM